MAVKIFIVILWVLMLCRIGCGYQSLEGACCLHLCGNDLQYCTSSKYGKSPFRNL